MSRLERVVYLNGAFVSEKDAKISIYDSALMFGDTVFEMTRSFSFIFLLMKVLMRWKPSYTGQ